MSANSTMRSEIFLFVCCFLFISAHHNRPGVTSFLFVEAYTSESMPRIGRPLAPPFPNGSCGGTVITLPRRDLFPKSSDNDNPFFNFNPIDAFSTLGNVVLPPRDVQVWLPREYFSEEHRSKQFQVLYCHDGQNAMEDASSWTGSSWRLVGALTRLSERKMLLSDTPPIVVCIPCGEGDFLPGISRRHSEYGDYTHPVAQAHGEFVAKTLHPYIIDRFRVKDGPQHTSVLGSSLGGQASLQLVLRYPDIFGGAACLSPCFQPATIAAVTANVFVNDNTPTDISQKNESNTAATNSNNLRSKRIYIDNGGDADDTKVPVFDVHDHFTLNEKFWNPGYWWLDTSLQPMIDALRFILQQGKVEHTYEKFPGGRHNERAWSRRIHRPLLALYGKDSVKSS